MRRWAALFGLLCGLSLLGVPAASATTLAAGAHAYPATTCSTLSVSTQHARPGQAITVSGSNFRPTASVHLVLKSDQGGSADSALGSARTDGTGSFTTQVTLPDSATNSRTYQIVATTGATSSQSCPADPSQTLDLLGANGSASGTGAGSSSGSGTAFTGLDIAALIAVALGLIGAGVILTSRRSTRRVSAGR